MYHLPSVLADTHRFLDLGEAALVVIIVAGLGTLIWVGAVISPWPELRWNELALILFPFSSPT